MPLRHPVAQRWRHQKHLLSITLDEPTRAVEAADPRISAAGDDVSARPDAAAAADAARGLDSAGRKVAGSACLVCGAQAVDTAHLVSRSRGACDAAACVVALCRRHPRAYDPGELDLLRYLEPNWRMEIGHAVEHLGLIGALRGLMGSRDDQ